MLRDATATRVLVILLVPAGVLFSVVGLLELSVGTVVVLSLCSVMAGLIAWRLADTAHTSRDVLGLCQSEVEVGIWAAVGTMVASFMVVGMADPAQGADDGVGGAGAPRLDSVAGVASFPGREQLQPGHR